MNLFSKLFRSRDKPKDYLSVHWLFYLVALPPGKISIKPDKEKSTEKIDGVVATIMALDRALKD